MKLLREMIGETVLASVPMIHPQRLQSLTLHAVDDGGIWVENQGLTDILLSAVKQHSSSRTPVFFVPFQQIFFLLQGTDKVSLSEKALGL